LEEVLTVEAVIEIVEAFFDEYQEREQQVDLTEVEESLDNIKTNTDNLVAIKQQLVIIDNRLDTEFKALNSSLQLITGALCFFAVWKMLEFVFKRNVNF